jgi:hypothetical protein
MATKKFTSIWIFLGILIIAALLLGFATSAGAQTYTMKCQETGHFPQMHRIEVGDVPGHIVFVGEQVGVLSCDDGSVATTSIKAMGDLTKGSGKAASYELFTYEDGSTTWIKAQCTIRPSPDGKTGIWEGGTFEYIKGTGRFEGIQGSGTFTGKRLAATPGAGAQYLEDLTCTYTLPSK